MREDAKIYHFADDARLYNHIKSIADAEILQQKMINSQTGLTDG